MLGCLEFEGLILPKRNLEERVYCTPKSNYFCDDFGFFFFFLLSSSRIPSGMTYAGYCALAEPLLSSWHVIRPCSQQMGHLGHLWIGKGNSSWCVYQDPATAPAPCHGTSSGPGSQAPPKRTKCSLGITQHPPSSCIKPSF